MIDGQNIAAVSRRSLRSQIAYVGQDVFLFRGSVRENIALGRPGATEAEIVAAAKAAYAHDFIMAFPRGYDTPGRRAWIAACRRRAPAHCHRPRAAQGRADHPARRGHRFARFRIRAAGAARDRAPVPGAHDDRDRAPAAYRHACRSHLRGRGRNGRRSRAATRSCCARAGVTPRSIACSCASRSRRRRSPSHPPLEFCNSKNRKRRS